MKIEKVKDVRRYVIQDSITGTEIDRARTEIEAKRIITNYIKSDVETDETMQEIDGRLFVDDFDKKGQCFYEINDTKTDEIIEYTQEDFENLKNDKI